MKNLIMGLALVISSLASAAVGVEKYEIVNAEFDSQHLRNATFAYGSIEVNYEKQNLKLFAQTRFHCPPGRYCAAVMPAPLQIELPIQSVKTDVCNVKQIVASEDRRPVDGDLQQVTLTDASLSTCLGAQPRGTDSVIQATYLTNYYDRIGGKSVTSESTILLKKVSPVAAVKVFKFASGQFVKGYPSLEIPVRGTLSVSANEVELTVYKALNCKPDQACPRYMPVPIVEKMAIVKVVKSSCGDTIIATKDDGKHVADGINRKIEIKDYSTALCDIMIRFPVTVKYTTEGGFAGRQTEAVLNFSKETVKSEQYH